MFGIRVSNLICYDLLIVFLCPPLSSPESLFELERTPGQELTDEKFLHRTVWAVAESSAADIDACNILQAALPK